MVKSSNFPHNKILKLIYKVLQKSVMEMSWVIPSFNGSNQWT